MDHTALIKKIKNSIAFILVGDGKSVGTGSGFVYGSPNLLVTCNHVVVDPNAQIKIKFPDTDFVDAKVVIRDEEHDLAILKFEHPDRICLEDGSGISVQEGMPIVFSGYPLDIYSLTTHQGIISAIVSDPTGSTTYVLDGTVNPGNSGCPLLTVEGKVIGVVNATSRQNKEVLDGVDAMSPGALALHGVDVVKIFRALTSNLQLGIGFSVPSFYIPPHIEGKPKRKKT